MRNNSNVSKLLAGVHDEASRKRNVANRTAGMIPLKEATESGKFTKIAWDVYREVNNPDAGAIWTVSEIDGEKWLVVHTDPEDHIIRGLEAEIANKMKKEATTKNAISPTIGDTVEIAATTNSINRKYNGVRGEVINAYPERSNLALDGGYTMYIENKDLKLVRSANVLDLNDIVRIKNRTKIEGTVEKINGNAITFKSKSGQVFSARVNELEKRTKQGQYNVVWFSGDDPKALKYLSPTDNKPAENGLPPTNVEKVPAPPEIKGQPSGNEIASGTAIPAQDVVPMTTKQMALNELNRTIYGRTLNIYDEILNKTSDQKGVIINVAVDKKLGKYYLIDYGNGRPVQEFETNLMKITPSPRAMEKISPPGEMFASKLKELGLTKEAQGAGGIETLRGGGGGTTPNVQPLTWEVENAGSEVEKAQQNTINDTLNEKMIDEDLGGDTINIQLDPKTKKITIDFGDNKETEFSDELKGTTVPPPGSPVGGTPGPGAQSEFGQSDIGVEF